MKQKKPVPLSLIHMAGLPIADGVPVVVNMLGDKFTFEYNQNTYNLPFDRIEDIVAKREEEIQSAYVSSIGGAVGGALLFGPLGAMIGGRVKKKTSRDTSFYMIFSYTKDGEIAFISFEFTMGLGIKVFEFIQAFKAIPRETKNIDL